MSITCKSTNTPCVPEVEVVSYNMSGMKANSPDHFPVSDEAKQISKKPNASPDPLMSSKLVNILPKLGDDLLNSAKNGQHDCLTSVDQSMQHLPKMELILAQMAPKSQVCSTNHDLSSGVERAASHLEGFVAGIETNPRVDTASLATSHDGDLCGQLSRLASQTGLLSLSTPQEDRGEGAKTATEVNRLKQELLAANSRIAQQEQELAQTRVMKHTLDQALGTSSDLDYGGRDISEQTISSLQSTFNASTRILSGPKDFWAADGSRSDGLDAWPSGNYSRASSFWTPTSGVGENNYNDPAMARGSLMQDCSRAWYPQASIPKLPHGGSQSQRVLSGPIPMGRNGDGRNGIERSPHAYKATLAPRRSISQLTRGIPISDWEQIGPGSSVGTGSRSPATPHFPAYPQAGMYPMTYHQPRSAGGSLSPTAAEFTVGSGSNAQWANAMSVAAPAQTYVSPLEPINYRRLLDKNVSCDWKYIVDKIVCNNDQQASIFLQQKLKVGTAEQKYDIIEAIVHQAYPLMVNRFGNFLVQRCFEHGTPDQVVAIANAIKGNTLSLSMDPFGCHVIQKAFDSVPEEHKAFMVHELLRRIPETVIHRYACHVWQKLFELRWSNEPPQVMAKVNEALRGMWHEVALGETGSLVVQNIFENCVEDEKRPAIEEVLNKIDLLAHGQFGNWCIQHICEHGAPHDKSRAIEHILHWSADYSMDQFASKVVEKCLKIGGPEFLDRYLARVCTGRPDRPRMPLIDIAGDQYGNYLIQWVLLHAALHQRELVASHIRKHMVSLRGSKFGSRVAMLCCNPSHTTRPGPGAGAQISRFGNPNDERLQTTSGNRTNRASPWSHNYPPFR